MSTHCLHTHKTRGDLTLTSLLQLEHLPADNRGDGHAPEGIQYAWRSRAEGSGRCPSGRWRAIEEFLSQCTLKCSRVFTVAQYRCWPARLLCNGQPQDETRTTSLLVTRTERRLSIISVCLAANNQIRFSGALIVRQWFGPLSGLRCSVLGHQMSIDRRKQREVGR